MEVVVVPASHLRRENVRRRRLCCGRPNSGESAVVGGNNLFECFPPAEQPLAGGNALPEKGLVSAISVPESNCSPEDIDIPEPNSGESAVVGGNNLFGSSPPTEQPLTGGNPYRRRGYASYLSSDERMFAGGYRFPGGRTPAKPWLSEVIIFLGSSPPAEHHFTGGNALPEKGVVPANSVPARECSPEEFVLRMTVVRRSRVGQR
ncbi:hypothetical protein SDC9_119112 [bioreactor metagenome]|uniref:Uncharacterized protein n=1 Tax=bioreactor metagenome TaxID=1076179 RepID=A0A645C3D8_9ZZZZ